MDPITQGVLGASAANLASNKNHIGKAVVMGALAGMAADLDVLIRSSSDPLLALEYHRQFTHSLIFVPIGALCCGIVFALVLNYLNRRSNMPSEISFGRIYTYSFLGYATHALLDACTTYGTQLFWPFANTRVAWNNVSVVDPLFTLPLLFLLLISVRKRSRYLGILAVSYALLYLALGVVQQKRAELAAQQLASSRGHLAINLGLKPSFANIIVWKSVYEHQGRYYVDAIRAGMEVGVLQGSSTPKLDIALHYPWLDSASQQAIDLERFRWFSNQHLGVDPDNEMRVIDIRYSLLPNRLDGMWGVVLDPSRADSEHIEWNTSRPQALETSDSVTELLQMITNQAGKFN